jgi:hypothetical protein
MDPSFPTHFGLPTHGLAADAAADRAGEKTKSGGDWVQQAFPSGTCT